MEYEIESETVLFDPSTNPSLDSWARVPEREPRRLGKRRLQRGEVIPEEDRVA